MKWMLAALLCAFAARARAQYDPLFPCPASGCAGLMAEAQAEHDRIMARMVRAEFAPGELDKLALLKAAVCAARDRRVSVQNEEHRAIYVLALPGRSLTVVRLRESAPDCAAQTLHLSASRRPWLLASTKNFSFDVSPSGEALVDRDEYPVFLEEKAFWLAFKP